MNMYARKAGGAIVVLVVLALLANSSAMASITGQLDSSSFGYQYEFDILPSEEDLDANQVNDFTLDGTGTLLNGIYSVNSTKGSEVYFISSATDQIWAQSGITYETGYTIETRVRVNSTDPLASYGTVYVQASTGDNVATSWLNLDASEQSWGYSTLALPSVVNDNSDGFHIFRIAKEANTSSFSVWRDEVLIYTEIGSGYNNLTLNHLVLGDKSTTVLGGSIDYDYLRFTAGAFAPMEVPEPTTLTLLALLAVGGLVLRRKIA